MSDLAIKSEDALDKHLIKMDKVVGEYLQGTPPHDIARKLGMSTGQVGGILKEWRGLASNNDALKTRATLAVRTADEHYTKLIKKAYEALDSAEDNDNNTQRMNAIKLIVEIEKTRFDMLQKAGALEDSDISQKVMEAERKQQVVMDILKNTVGPCNRCRPLVQNKLAEMTNDVVVIKAESL